MVAGTLFFYLSFRIIWRDWCENCHSFVPLFSYYRSNSVWSKLYVSTNPGDLLDALSSHLLSPHMSLFSFPSPRCSFARGNSTAALCLKAGSQAINKPAVLQLNFARFFLSGNINISPEPPIFKWFTRLLLFFQVLLKMPSAFNGFWWV